MYSAQNDYENVACLVTRKSGAVHIYTSVADFGSNSYLLFNHCKPNKKSNTIRGSDTVLLLRFKNAKISNTTGFKSVWFKSRAFGLLPFICNCVLIEFPVALRRLFECKIAARLHWDLLLIWITFYPSMDEQSHQRQSVAWNHLSTPKRQRLHICGVQAVSEWIRNSIPYFTGHLITYPWWDLSQTMLVKGAQTMRLNTNKKTALNERH